MQGKGVGQTLVAMIPGRLHTEMAGLNMIGHSLQCSGWVEALVQAQVESPGTADFYLKSFHVTQKGHGQ